MSTLEQKVEELRREPSRWSSYDESTRELLKRQAEDQRPIVKRFDPSNAGRTMG